MSTDYGDLSTKDLAKQINEEYALILAAERTYLQKALSLGEKLIALRQRVAPKHGQWQTKLKEYCPDISYEKANLCIRFVENLDKLEAYAASKNVKLTDLGIEEARQALTKSKHAAEGGSDSESESDDESGGKPTPEAMKAREAANAEAEAKALAVYEEEANEKIAKQHIEEVWDASELVDVVLEVRDVDYLKAVMIAALKRVDASFLKELAMELQKALDPRLPPRPPAAPPAGVVAPASDVVARRI